MKIPAVVRWLLPVVLVSGTILVAVIPGNSELDSSSAAWLIAVTPSLIQNLAHFFVYLVLVWSIAWPLMEPGGRDRALAIAFVICVAMGTALEFYQLRIPGRFASLLDILTNVAGATAGLYIASRWLRRHGADSLQQPAG